MGTVIAAIDNTATARAVLAAAAALAGVLEAGLEAVHVREDGDMTALAEARAVGVALRELPDPVAESLVREATAAGVDALVLGARGTPVGRHPAGHVALGVIAALTKPLLVVPPEVQPSFRVRRFLVPLDGTRTTAEALRETISLACDSGLEVVVLHVFEEASLPLFDDQRQHEARAWGDEFLARWSPCPDASVSFESRVGVPAESVLRVARERAVDVVALGWSGDLGPGKAEVVRQVLARSVVPVLLVPVAVAVAR